MGKFDKDNVDPKGFDVAGTSPGEGLTANPVIVSSINTEAEAREFVKNGGYKITESRVIYVTQDKNVFTQENESAAVNHAERNKLKIFRIG